MALPSGAIFTAPEFETGIPLSDFVAIEVEIGQERVIGKRVVVLPEHEHARIGIEAADIDASIDILWASPRFREMRLPLSSSFTRERGRTSLKVAVLRSELRALDRNRLSR